jgi:hypothetical protein
LGFARIPFNPTDRTQLEQAARQSTLPDNGLQGAPPNFRVVRNGDRRRVLTDIALHDDMTAAPPHLDKTVLGEIAHTSRPLSNGV